jgi:MYXO-CTERM domain-containing protein
MIPTTPIHSKHSQGIRTSRRFKMPDRKAMMQCALILPLMGVIAFSALEGYSLVQPDEKAVSGQSPIAKVQQANPFNPSTASNDSGMTSVTISTDSSVGAQAVPEPSSWALGAIVVVLFGALRFRRNRA